MGKKFKKPEEPAVKNGPSEKEGTKKVENSLESLESRLTHLIDCIPPINFGFDPNVIEIIRDHKHETVNKKLNHAKSGRMSNARKHKLARFDDEQLHTVSHIWEYLRRTNKITNKIGKNVEPCESPALDSSKSLLKVGDNVKNGRSENRAEALIRLQDKINDMKKNRTSRKTAIGHEEIRKLKRRQSKLKRKERIKKENKEGVKGQKMENNYVKKEGDKEINNDVISEPNIVFSKFEFASGIKSRFDEKQEKRKLEKKNKGILAHKDPSKNIKQLERREKKLESLKEQGNLEEVKKVEDESKWATALQKAQGIKVKDNPELLKKSLKKREALKKRSTKKWESRQKSVREKQEQQQDKRQKNLDKRKHDKKKKTLDKARKRGRLV